MLAVWFTCRSSTAYRRREWIGFTTLDHMNECDIALLTTVLIGNCNIFVRHGAWSRRAATPTSIEAVLMLLPVEELPSVGKAE